MEQDIKWKKFLSNNSRYADIINGIINNGTQLVTADSIHDISSRHISNKARDTVRKTAFGINFAIIGIENQETIDYSMPLRNMLYDAAEYEQQAALIRKEVRKHPSNLTDGEYLYGFKRNSHLYPVVTFILYAGKTEWDGAVSLHEILDFSDIPKQLKDKVQDYKINLIEIRKLQNTQIFKTDVRYVFDFIRFSEDKTALNKLVESNPYYQNMEEDAFDVAAYYTNADELIAVKEYYKEENKINMCTAIKELIADGRKEGLAEGRTEGLAEGRTEGIIGAVSICRKLNLPEDIIAQNLRETYNLSDKEIKEFLFTV